MLLKTRGKQPTEKDWPNKKPTQEEVEAHVTGGGNVGVLLGAKSNGLSDVDLDSGEARALARAFLIPTGLVHGRASSRASHWWYRVSGDLKKVVYKDPSAREGERGTLLEVRGDGHQTAVPPSVHPSGEQVEWEKDGEPAAVTAEELLTSTAWLAITSLLVRVWVKDDRNDLALWVAGWLLRAGVDPDVVEHLIYQVALAAGDEEADQRSNVVRPTAEKLKRKEAVGGWNKLAEAIGAPRAQALRGWLPKADQDVEEEATSFPAPLGVRELLELSELKIEWRVVGLMELGAKVLIAAYSKTHKTNLALELAVAVATATPFLGKFEVPQWGRVGLIMMEDAPRHVSRRLSRLALRRGVSLKDLEGFVYVWPRPPFVLTLSSVEKLRRRVDELELDMIVVDNFALVSRGNSNNADEVTPQLVALSELARNRPGLVIVLLHHGKKRTKDDGNRLTDLVRGSGAFTAWTTCGMFLSRKNEDSPVDVRIELRNLPPPPTFRFDVKDEYTRDSKGGTVPGGWFRLYVVERDVKDSQTIKREQAVLDYLRDNPGCSLSKLRKGVVGKGTQVDRAFKQLCKERRALVEKSGRAHKCYALDDDGEIDDNPSY